MELDVMPDQDGSRHSERGSVWIHSLHSEASGASRQPSSPSNASPLPTQPSLLPSPTPLASPTPISSTLLAALEEDPFPLDHRSNSSPLPCQDVRDQPFMDEFWLLTDMQRSDDIVAALDPQPMDVNRWELVLSPQEYLNRFKDSLADIQLISRAPLQKLHTTYHRGPAFDKYLLLAEATHQLWVDLRYKEPFFDELNRYHIAQPGRLSLQASLGNVHLPTAGFIHCLIAAGCHTIRLKAYGQKMPMTNDFLHNEPAQTNHRWTEHNEWDIGTSFTSPYISPCLSPALVTMAQST
jgi:hypothetical protein